MSAFCPCPRPEVTWGDSQTCVAPMPDQSARGTDGIPEECASRSFQKPGDSERISTNAKGVEKGGKAFQREDQAISRNDREFKMTAFAQILSPFLGAQG